MGAETQNQRLAGSAAARMRAAQDSREGIEQRRAAIRQAEEAAPETGKASMFPGEAPGPSPVTPPPGAEEMAYQRGEITRERDRSGRREEMFRDFERGAAKPVAPGGAVERGAGVFGAPFGGAGQGEAPGAGLRSGIQFGPGRTTRMPDVGSPEYQRLLERVRAMGQR
jgi:hypothetical protein